MCPNCPYCAKSHRPCADAFGSNACSTGGVLGRIDAVYGAIECQRSGTLHGHFQFFVQCLHQHTPLQHIQKNPLLVNLVKQYGVYSSHVRKTTYCNLEEWTEEHQAAVENQWPEFRNRPRYQSSPDMLAPEWKDAYLSVDVEALQKHKQHHVHLPPDAPGEPRKPSQRIRCISSVIPLTAPFQNSSGWAPLSAMSS